MDSTYSLRGNTDEGQRSEAPRRLFAGAYWPVPTGFTARILFGVAAIIAATNELMRAIRAALGLPTEQGNFHSGILVPSAGPGKASQPMSLRGNARDQRVVERETLTTANYANPSFEMPN
ncbi:hypothetical protein GCM10023346_16910 [Arthrobacter gyeryongensis]|uniref:Uncharacterized protein n=1 Tax=Arthrobacter gyeryongensis TaxID=1650592 RepID=A0ABP9SC11_9MICC